MEDNQPVTANSDADFDHIVVGNGIMIPVGSRNIDGMVASLHTQDPTNGADFDTLMKSINERRRLAAKYLDDSNCASLSKEMLGFNLLPEK